jgi:hypothetical protein
VNDARELWQSIALSGSGSDGGTAPALEAFVVVSVALPHMRHRADHFEDACNAFGRRLKDSKASDYRCKAKFSRHIRVDSCVVFAWVIWDSFSLSSSHGFHRDARTPTRGIGMLLGSRDLGRE